MDVIGARIPGGCQVLRQLARGAVARVFLASDGSTLKAVKLFPPEYRSRAEREFALGRGLDHPHLNPVTAAAAVRGFPGVVMPFVPGVRFGAWVDSAHDLTQVLECFTGVLAALGWLHEHGIVHRDVKPENVLVDSSHQARLLDFDLAARMGDPRQPRFVGTMAYVSPEQAQGLRATPASDLYSAGVMLFRALTGQLPFDGTAAEVVKAHVNQAAPAASSLNPALTPFDALLHKLLNKEPERRCQRAGEIAEALERIAGQADLPVRWR